MTVNRNLGILGGKLPATFRYDAKNKLPDPGWKAIDDKREIEEEEREKCVIAMAGYESHLVQNVDMQRLGFEWT